MALAEALMELEGLQFPEIEASAGERLRLFVETSGGLPIERDCQSKEILAVGDDDMRETLLPLCRWVLGLTTHIQGSRVLVGVSGSAGAGKSTQLHDPVPDCVIVAPGCSLIIVEGLHLLHQEGLWKDVFAALHRTVFLDIERLC
eukprot:g15791.t1